MDGREPGERRGLPGLGTAGDQQVVVVEDGSVIQGQSVGFGVESGCPATEEELDSVVGVPGLGLEVYVHSRRALSEELLGQRRTVVGDDRLGADHTDGVFEPLLPQGLGAALGGESTSDDQGSGGARRAPPAGIERLVAGRLNLAEPTR